jgi:Flp pilus assembly pilin Flp
MPVPLEERPSGPTKGGLVRDRRGATIVEYAILLVLVLITAAAVFRVLGKDVRKSGDMATAQFT